MAKFGVTYYPYEWQWFVKDFVAGITLLTILIPQSMAYSVLAGLPPVVGLYSSLAVLPFAVLASNSTCTVGPFTVTQILMRTLRPIYLASFIGGIMQVIIAPFSGFIGVWLLPKTYMSGFTSGCAFLIAAAQIDDFFGISLVKPDQFTVVLKLIDIFRKIQNIHLPTFAIGAVSLLLIYVLKKLNVYLKTKPKFSKVWIPDIFVVCLLATLLSYFLNFQKLGVKIVGHIPKGFPEIVAPWNYDDAVDINWISLIVDTLPVAIVSSSITLSVLTQYNTPQTVIPQDMLLAGLSSMAISFFQGFLATGSLTRSALQKEVGAMTQISNIVLCILLILVLISIAPLFEPVPMASLAAIVMLAAKSLLRQLVTIGWPLFLDAKKYYYRSINDIELQDDANSFPQSPENCSNDQSLSETSSFIISGPSQFASTSMFIAEFEQNPYIQFLYFWVPCFGIFFFNVQVTLAFSVCLILLWKTIYAVVLWRASHPS